MIQNKIQNKNQENNSVFPKLKPRGSVFPSTTFTELPGRGNTIYIPASAITNNKLGENMDFSAKIKELKEKVRLQKEREDNLSKKQNSTKKINTITNTNKNNNNINNYNTANELPSQKNKQVEKKIENNSDNISGNLNINFEREKVRNVKENEKTSAAKEINITKKEIVSNNNKFKSVKDMINELNKKTNAAPKRFSVQIDPPSLIKNLTFLPQNKEEKNTKNINNNINKPLQAIPEKKISNEFKRAATLNTRSTKMFAEKEQQKIVDMKKEESKKDEIKLGNFLSESTSTSEKSCPFQKKTSCEIKRARFVTESKDNSHNDLELKPNPHSEEDLEKELNKKHSNTIQKTEENNEQTRKQSSSFISVAANNVKGGVKGVKKILKLLPNAFRNHKSPNGESIDNDNDTKNNEKENITKKEIAKVGDDLDNHWEYVKILLDYNIIDFTSKYI